MLTKQGSNADDEYYSNPDQKESTPTKRDNDPTGNKKYTLKHPEYAHYVNQMNENDEMMFDDSAEIREIKNSRLGNRAPAKVTQPVSKAKPPAQPKTPQKTTTNQTQKLTQNNEPRKLDLSKKATNTDKANNLETIIRIRDPVTSKVKVLTLNDDQLDELTKRHQQDKERVNDIVYKTQNQNEPRIQNEPAVKTSFKNAQPVATTTTTKAPTSTIAKTSSTNNLIGANTNTNTNTTQQPTATSPVKPRKPVNLASGDEDKFQQLLNRHNYEKQNVDNIKTNLVNPVYDTVAKSVNSTNNPKKESPLKFSSENEHFEDLEI